MKFSIKDFLSKSDQIRSFLQIWWQLLKKSLMENFIFCAVNFVILACISHATRLFRLLGKIPYLLANASIRIQDIYLVDV